MATVTTGWQRISSATMREFSGVGSLVVPYASVYVTLTSSGAAAVIYSDPALSITIPGSVVTADQDGNYNYFVPLNYNVTENISSASGSLYTISNISNNGPLVTTLTTTANATDTVTLVGVISTSHVFLQPTNSTAATMLTSTYVSSVSAGQFVVTHPSTAGATFNVLVTPY